MLPEGKDLGRYFAIGQVGFEMVLPIAAGILLDTYLGWAPWGVVVGTIVGFAGGLLHLVLVVRKLDKKDSSDDSARPTSGAK